MYAVRKKVTKKDGTQVYKYIGEKDGFTSLRKKNNALEFKTEDEAWDYLEEHYTGDSLEGFAVVDINPNPVGSEASAKMPVKSQPEYNPFRDDGMFLGYPNEDVEPLSNKERLRNIVNRFNKTGLGYMGFSEDEEPSEREIKIANAITSLTEAGKAGLIEDFPELIQFILQNK